MGQALLVLEVVWMILLVEHIPILHGDAWESDVFWEKYPWVPSLAKNNLFDFMQT